MGVGESGRVGERVGGCVGGLLSEEAGSVEAWGAWECLGDEMYESEERMSVVMSDTMLETAQLSAEEFLLEVAVLFYQQKRLTLAQASVLAGIDRLKFQQMLANRDISIHYDEQDLETDVQTLQKLHFFTL